jgi:hypothetical protein
MRTSSRILLSFPLLFLDWIFRSLFLPRKIGIVAGGPRYILSERPPGSVQRCRLQCCKRRCPPSLSLSLLTHSLTHSLSLTHLLFIAFAFVFFHRFRYFSHSDVHATNLKTPMAVNAPCNGCVSRFFLEIGCLLIPRNVGGIISSTGTNHGLTV